MPHRTAPQALTGDRGDMPVPAPDEGLARTPPGTAVRDLPISWQPPFRRRPAAGAERKRACAVGIHRRRRRRHPHARPSRPVPGPYIQEPFDMVRRGRAGPDLFFARRRTDRHLPVLYRIGTAASGARRGRRKRVRTGLDRQNGRVTSDDSNKTRPSIV